MSSFSINVENLGKLYHLRGRRLCYHTFRDTLSNKVSSAWHRLWRNGRAESSGAPPQPETIWALKDVSFQIKQGEVVGLIGRNGAGKSTLLKLLSRVTEPTEGHAEIYGRIGSLLEVGTGFHPELTGRENTYLSGAILGMKRAEITRKFDEIVAFAEVEKFIDTPCKHYSTGMYLRLAFAVAAHLETEILLVDEVLAVGDAAFQKKCLGKMGEVAHEGRTVVFVSHNMGAITSLCPNSFLLRGGQLARYGPSTRVVEEYLEVGAASSYAHLSAAHHVRGDGAVKIERVLLSNLEGQPQAEFQVWEPMQIHIGFTDSGSARSVYFFVLITASDGQVLLSSVQSDTPSVVRLPSESNSVRVTIPAIPLAPGEYLLSVGVCGQYRQLHDWVEHGLGFRVVSSIYQGGPYGNRPGRVVQRWEWETTDFPQRASQNHPAAHQAPPTRHRSSAVAV